MRKDILFITCIIVFPSCFQKSIIEDNSGRIYKKVKANGAMIYYDTEGKKRKNINFVTEDSVYQSDPGGMRQVGKSLLRNFILPRDKLEYFPKNSTSIIISILVEKDGCVSNIRIIEGIKGIHDKEMIKDISKIERLKYDISRIGFLPCEFTTKINTSF
jgi:hypothetical protein